MTKKTEKTTTPKTPKTPETPRIDINQFTPQELAVIYYEIQKKYCEDGTSYEEQQKLRLLGSPEWVALKEKVNALQEIKVEEEVKCSVAYKFKVNINKEIIMEAVTDGESLTTDMLITDVKVTHPHKAIRLALQSYAERLFGKAGDTVCDESLNVMTCKKEVQSLEKQTDKLYGDLKDLLEKYEVEHWQICDELKGK